jgi:hypothetical protein
MKLLRSILKKPPEQRGKKRRRINGRGMPNAMHLQCPPMQKKKEEAELKKESPYPQGGKGAWRSRTRHPRKLATGRRCITPGRQKGFNDEQIADIAEVMREWSGTNAHRKEARTTDWNKTFCGWIRRAAERKGGPDRTPRSPRRKVAATDSSTSPSTALTKSPPKDQPGFPVLTKPKVGLPCFLLRPTTTVIRANRLRRVLPEMRPRRPQGRWVSVTHLAHRRFHPAPPQPIKSRA